MPAVPKPVVAAQVFRAPSLPRWAVLGGVFGLVSAASIALWGPIGVSGTYPRVVAALLHWLAPGLGAGANGYLRKIGDVAKPETFLALGLLMGGFLAARFSPKRAPKVELIHPSHSSTSRRYLEAFLGGALVIFGARLAGGCTSGHIISGITQLSVSGFIFAAAVFASGILTARLLQKGGR
ncbi:MAG: YeeE/YedE thiosulfate transporter family protein [Myxococcaceae bacterium]